MKLGVQQVKQLFGFCGQVKSCRMVGNNQFAFVEYSSPGVSSTSAAPLTQCSLMKRHLLLQNQQTAVSSDAMQQQLQLVRHSELVVILALRVLFLIVAVQLVVLSKHALCIQAGFSLAAIICQKEVMLSCAVGGQCCHGIAWSNAWGQGTQGGECQVCKRNHPSRRH